MAYCCSSSGGGDVSNDENGGYGRLHMKSNQPQQETKEEDVEEGRNSNKDNMGRGALLGRRQRWMVVGMAAVGMGVAVACLAVGVVRLVSPDSNGKASSSPTIRKLCSSTLFPDTCESSLSGYPGAGAADPWKLVAISMRVGMQGMAQEMESVERLLLLHQSSSPPSIAALNDCIELLDKSMDAINTSLTFFLNSFDDADVRTWASASLTYHSTCLDGLQQQQQGNMMMGLEEGNTVTHLLSNSLALLTALSGGAGPSKQEEEGRQLDWVDDDGSAAADVVVSRDGSGNYTRIQEAVDAAPWGINGKRRYVIGIRAGLYEESISIPKRLTNIVLLGDGINHTVIRQSKSLSDGVSIYASATLAVNGDGFIAKDLTIDNDSGPEQMEGVAVRVSADRTAFFRCSFKGNRGTLYTHALRQFYRECTILGTSDFIFGNAAAVLQKCTLIGLALPPLNSSNSNQQSIAIAGQMRTDPGQNTGLSFDRCSIDFSSSPIYLGCPHRNYSRVAFLQSHLSAAVDPAGWLQPPPSSLIALERVVMGEYRNQGPGSQKLRRVKWSTQLTPKQASSLSVKEFINGSKWLPTTGIRFDLSI
ncbi:hypothetical protein AMTRI_Chr11g149870 [Amborella trichopoda]